jgi:hypothetical protein
MKCRYCGKSLASSIIDHGHTRYYTCDCELFNLDKSFCDEIKRLESTLKIKRDNLKRLRSKGVLSEELKTLSNSLKTEYNINIPEYIDMPQELYDYGY